MRMAMMQMELILATILQGYVFRPVSNAKLEFHPVLNLRPANGIWMTLQKLS